MKLSDGLSFIERLHKEETLQRTFEKRFLSDIHTLISSAHDVQSSLAATFQVLNLPPFDDELEQLISFPTRLINASLRVRLESANRVSASGEEPDVLVVNQTLEDLQLSIGLACTLKRQYEAFIRPDPGGGRRPLARKCIKDGYDQVVLDTLVIFFRFIDCKLKYGSKDASFRETDILEGYWSTFNDVSLMIEGGAPVVAEQLWLACSFLHYLLHFLSDL